jgi:hypothetical protein
MYFWTIAIIASSIQYVGQFQEETACNKAVESLKTQYVKAVCIQAKSPEVAKK